MIATFSNLHFLGCQGNYEDHITYMFQAGNMLPVERLKAMLTVL